MLRDLLLYNPLSNIWWIADFSLHYFVRILTALVQGLQKPQNETVYTRHRDRACFCLSYTSFAVEVSLTSLQTISSIPTSFVFKSASTAEALSSSQRYLLLHIGEDSDLLTPRSDSPHNRLWLRSLISKDQRWSLLIQLKNTRESIESHLLSHRILFCQFQPPEEIGVADILL